jgi:hypothetical protein
MNPTEMDKIAKDIVAVTKALADFKALHEASPQGAALALARTAAKYVVDTGGTKQDFFNLINAAWDHASRNP